MVCKTLSRLFSKFRIFGSLLRRCLGLVIILAMDHTALANNNQGGDKHGFWLWSFLGRLHPMIVHFPISLLYAALLFEAISWKRKSAQFKAAAQVMVYAGSISAILAVVLGLILSNTDDYGSSLLPVHQWLGIATMVFACITAYYYL